MVCLTDQPERCSGVAFIDISIAELPGWWGKLMLFEPQWRAGKKIIFLDLAVSVVGDISPLADVPGEFSICANYVGVCKYNSSVMVLGVLLGDFVWRRFEQRRGHLMNKHQKHGDQSCIEELYPSAQLLQRVLPKGFVSDPGRSSIAIGCRIS
jgi:hypothetical protein